MEEAERQAADDSEEEFKFRELRHHNDKLLFINQADSKRFERVEEDDGDSQMDEREASELPIVMHEREIMESIEGNVVTIVCGETGSGKST